MFTRLQAAQASTWISHHSLYLNAKKRCEKLPVNML
jgi:hypothetical protein